MQFKKGQSGNPSGKPAGTKNKFSGSMRENLSNFLRDNYVLFVSDFKKLKPYQRVRVYQDLIQYDTARLQAVTNTFNFEDMTEEQLDKIIDKLKASAMA